VGAPKYLAPHSRALSPEHINAPTAIIAGEIVPGHAGLQLKAVFGRFRVEPVSRHIDAVYEQVYRHLSGQSACRSGVVVRVSRYKP
jgi:hypothetical protein